MWLWSFQPYTLLCKTMNKRIERVPNNLHFLKVDKELDPTILFWQKNTLDGIYLRFDWICDINGLVWARQRRWKRLIFSFSEVDILADFNGLNSLDNVIIFLLQNLRFHEESIVGSYHDPARRIARINSGTSFPINSSWNQTTQDIFDNIALINLLWYDIRLLEKSLKNWNLLTTLWTHWWCLSMYKERGNSLKSQNSWQSM